MNAYQISELSKRIGVSADTLRYYEKIGLLPPVARSTSGRRIYGDKDISRLNFIRRAQRMNFTLKSANSWRCAKTLRTLAPRSAP